MIEGIGILYILAPTAPTNRQIKLVVAHDALQQIPRPFKIQRGLGVQHLVGLKRTANPMAILDVGSGPAGIDLVRCIDPK